jgi:hypothetical protein
LCGAVNEAPIAAAQKRRRPRVAGAGWQRATVWRPAPRTTRDQGRRRKRSRVS